MASPAPLAGFVVRWLPNRDNQELLYVGCPLNGDGTLQFEVETRYADPTNKLEYAIVSWPRDRFPEAFSSSMLVVVDPCDTDVWASMWTKPLAGTLAYMESDPVLLTNPGSAADSWVEVETLGGRVKRVTKRQLDARPSGPIKVRDSYQAPECRVTPATNASSSKFSACMAEVDGRYAAGIAVAESRSRNAESAVVRDLASQQETSLMTRREHDRERCKPLYKTIVAAHQHAFEQVRTTLEHAQVTTTTAGIARVLAEYKAFE
jgi:hypothetical protein